MSERSGTGAPDDALSSGITKREYAELEATCRWIETQLERGRRCRPGIARGEKQEETGRR